MHARLARLVFGGTCFICRGAARAQLCEDCDADLPRLRQPLCPRCALESPSGAICGVMLSVNVSLRTMAGSLLSVIIRLFSNKRGRERRRARNIGRRRPFTVL